MEEVEVGLGREEVWGEVWAEQEEEEGEGEEEDGLVSEWGLAGSLYLIMELERERQMQEVKIKIKVKVQEEERDGGMLLLLKLRGALGLRVEVRVWVLHWESCRLWGGEGEPASVLVLAEVKLRE